MNHFSTFIMIFLFLSNRQNTMLSTFLAFFLLLFSIIEYCRSSLDCHLVVISCHLEDNRLTWRPAYDWQESRCIGCCVLHHHSPPSLPAPHQPHSVRRRESPKPGSGRALECCLATGAGAVLGRGGGDHQPPLSQGDEQHRPISYAGLGPWVWVEVGWVHPVSWLH